MNSINPLSTPKINKLNYKKDKLGEVPLWEIQNKNLHFYNLHFKPSVTLLISFIILS